MFEPIGEKEKMKCIYLPLDDKTYAVCVAEDKESYYEIEEKERKPITKEVFEQKLLEYVKKHGEEIR